MELHAFSVSQVQRYDGDGVHFRKRGRGHKKGDTEVMWERARRAENSSPHLLFFGPYSFRSGVGNLIGPLGARTNPYKLT